MSGTEEDPDFVAPERHPSFHRRRTAVSSQPISENTITNFQAKIVPKNQAELESLNAILYQNCLFSHLEKNELKAVVDAMEKKVVHESEVIMQQGGKGENFFVVGRGQVGVVIHDERVSRIREGGTFGELELMYQTPCAATIVAETPEVELWAIDRHTYRLLIMHVSMTKRRQYEDLIGKVPLFKNLNQCDKLTLADALTPCSYKDGEYILRYGEEGEWLYIIVEGVVVVIGRTQDGDPIKVCEFREGDHFGDLEFVNNHTHIADVQARGQVKAVKLNRYHIELCMGAVKEALKGNINNPLYAYYREKMLARTFKYIGGRAGRRRAQVSSESYEPLDSDFQFPSYSKEDELQMQLHKQLANSPLFNHLRDDDLYTAINAMTCKTYKENDTITQQGLHDNTVYVIQEGRASSQVDESDPIELGPGSIFGEMELLYNTACATTVKSITELKCWTLDKQTYRHIIMRLQIRKRKDAEQLLLGLDCLHQFSPYQLLTIAECITRKDFKDGDTVCQSDQEVDNVVILLNGTLNVKTATGTDIASITTTSSLPILGVWDVTIPDCENKWQVTATSSGNCSVGLLPANQTVPCLSPLLELFEAELLAPTNKIASYYKERLKR